MTPNRKEVKGKYKKSICINWFSDIASFEREFLFQKRCKSLIELILISSILLTVQIYCPKKISVLQKFFY